MKRVTSVLFVFCLFLSSSCSLGSKDWEIAGSVAGSVWGAQSVEVSFENGANAKEEKNILLTMSHLQAVPKDYPKNRIVSISAMALIQNLKEATYKDYAAVHVIFDRGNGTEQGTISIHDIKVAMQLIPVVTDFLDIPIKDGMSERGRLVDSVLFPDSALLQFEEMLIQSDSIYGPTGRHQIGGFKFDHLVGNNEPVLIVWASAVKKEKELPYTFYISQKNGKIISLSTVE